MKRSVKALLIGTAATLVLFGLGYLAAGRQAETLSYVLYWQAWAMYQLLPCTYYAFADGLLCENERAAMVTFYAGIPVGVLVYSLAAYAALSWLDTPPKAAA